MRYFFLLCLFSAQSFATADKFASYISVAADRKSGMNLRWKALLSAADIASADQFKQIKNFVLSKDWYMRNAAIIALAKINSAEALIEAKKLLQDKALVVRSAAVEIVAQNLTQEHKKVLAAELQKSYNFHKKSSLWIRKQIIEKLSSSADIQDLDIFVKNLFDADKEVSLISAKTLEKITGQRVDDFKYIENWKALVRQNDWL